MRHFKFRAWDDKAKAWLCGYEYKNLGGFSLFGEVMLMGEWSGILSRFIVSQADRSWKDLIVTQATGVVDTQDEDIYEGDIVRTDDGKLWEVSRDVGCFRLVSLVPDQSGTHPRRSGILGECPVERVGNTFEPIKLTNSRVSSSDGDGGIDGEAEESLWENLKEKWEPLGFAVEISGDHIIARLKHG